MDVFDMQNSTAAQLGWPSVSSHVTVDNLSTLSWETEYLYYAWDIIREQLVISNFWKLLLVLHIAANFKHFPFIYHLRILNAVRFVCRSQRPKQDVKPEQLFQPLITEARSSLVEIDVYGHKSNSTYFADVDISRAHLVTTLFGRAIEKIRGGTTMNGLSGSSSQFTMALGAVSCSFRNEIRPYESYDLWTRVISWDQKWVYLVTHFVKKNAHITPREFTLYPKQKDLGSQTSSRQGSVAHLTEGTNGSMSALDRKQTPIIASAMSKIVFKEGRKTIAPEVMFELAGLLPPRTKDEKIPAMACAQVAANKSNKVSPKSSVTALQHTISPRASIAALQQVETGELDSKLSRRNITRERSLSSHSSSPILEKVEAGLSDSGSSKSSRRSSIDETIQEWTFERIEAERKRGMRMAELLAKQTSLEDEFSDEAALGRHSDGYGIVAMAATFAQLGGLSNYQVL